MAARKKQKIVCIVGPNAVGKSALGVKLAKKFDGEIISADSRQVYKGLDIGTGKITKKETRSVPHHLLSIADPRRQYSAARFKRDAEKTLRYIVRNGKLPIIVGGTGFYIDVLLGKTAIPEVPPDPALRKELEEKPATELITELKRLDPQRAKTIEQHNKRRLIRAIEIARHADERRSGADARRLDAPAHRQDNEISPQAKQSPYDVLMIGITLPKEKLRERIKVRLTKRMRRGMVAEARHLHEEGLSWKRMEELGLEYRYLTRFLRGKISKEEMLEQLETAIWQYAKRQMQWFKRDKSIHWFGPKDYKKIESEIKRFLGT